MQDLVHLINREITMTYLWGESVTGQVIIGSEDFVFLQMADGTTKIVLFVLVDREGIKVHPL